LGFPLASPLGWFPFKEAPFLTKLTLGLKIKLWNCLGFSPFEMFCLRLHSLYEGICFLNPNFSPHSTSEKPSIFVMTSKNEAGQFSSNLRLAQVKSPITKWHTSLIHAYVESQAKIQCAPSHIGARYSQGHKVCTLRCSWNSLEWIPTQCVPWKIPICSHGYSFLLASPSSTMWKHSPLSRIEQVKQTAIQLWQHEEILHLCKPSIHNLSILDPSKLSGLVGLNLALLKDLLLRASTSLVRLGLFIFNKTSNYFGMKRIIECCSFSLSWSSQSFCFS